MSMRDGEPESLKICEGLILKAKDGDNQAEVTLRDILQRTATVMPKELLLSLIQQSIDYNRKQWEAYSKQITLERISGILLSDESNES